MSKRFYLLFLLVLAIHGFVFAKAKPSARTAHSAVYDPVNKQMIVFGGSGGRGYLSDTWIYEIEKKEWSKIKTDKTPQARGYHSAIYDPENKQMIVFGGIENTKEWLSDTWVFNIEKRSWEEIRISSDDAPMPRANHSAVYDDKHKRMIIFGGGGSGVLGFYDTWKYDIKNKIWEEVDIKFADSPGMRWGHSAIYDPIGKQIIIFGGYIEADFGGQVNSELWTFDMESLQDNSAKASLKNKWKEIETDGDPVGSHSAIYDPENQQMIIFGGHTENGLSSKMKTYDINKKEWKEIEIEDTPKPRWEHTAIYDSANKQIIVFGGRCNTGDFVMRELSDLWIFDLNKKKWTEIKTKKDD